MSFITTAPPHVPPKFDSLWRRSGRNWSGRYVDILAGEQFRPEFLAINPKAVVPVLIHDGQIIRELTVICEYAEEIFPQHPIYPSSPIERARVRLWTKAVDEELHPACSAVTYIASHRHTILRSGIGSFEDFLAKELAKAPQPER